MSVLDPILKEIRNYCSKIIPFVNTIFPHYAEHNESHAKRVYQYIINLIEPIHVEEDILLSSAAYLHDIGMALMPTEWSKLRITKNYVLKDIKPEKQEEYSHLFGDKEYLESIDLKGLRLKDFYLKHSKIARKMHPWISARLIESTDYENSLYNYLRENLPKGLCGTELKVFIKMLATVVKLHSSSSNLDNYRNRNMCAYYDYEINIAKAAATLSLADTLDCTKERAKSLELLCEFIAKLDMLQIKHWVFKKFVDKVDIRENNIIIEVNTVSLPEVAGVLLFEVGKNIYKDYIRSQNIYKDYKIEYALSIKIPSYNTYTITEAPLLKDIVDKEKNMVNIKPYIEKYEELRKIFAEELSFIDILAVLCEPTLAREKNLPPPEDFFNYLYMKTSLMEYISPEARKILEEIA